MNVDITVRDFKYGYKTRNKFLFRGEKIKTKWGEKGPKSIWEIIY